MVEAIISTLILWVGFIFISAIILVLGILIMHYGLKLIDKTEEWYKGQDNDRKP